MSVLVAAVVLVGVLGVINLVFSFGIIRRLREHTEILNNTSGHGHSTLSVPAGDTVGEFAVSTADGAFVSRESLTGPTLVGFFSPGCEPCKEQLPRFAAMARSYPDGRVLAVVTGSDDEAAAPAVSQLSGVAAVLREEELGPVQQAFGVRGYPAFAVVEPGGLVRASERAVDRLPAPTPA